MRQDKLSPAPGSKKDRKRVGRGDGSGHGTYSGRGCKGDKARAGHHDKRGFEGGQMALTQRLPKKRGFTNIFRTTYTPVNLGKLSIFEAGSEVTLESMLAAGLINSLEIPVKILAEGDVSHPLNIKVHRCSAAARAKIEAAGGKVEEIGNETKAD